MRKGFKGLWDKLTGTYQRTRAKNDKETQQKLLRDRAKKEKLVSFQLTKRKQLQSKFQQARQKHTNERAALIKGMSKHFQKIDRQAEIKKLYE